jgi:hypothetical protein
MRGLDWTWKTGGRLDRLHIRVHLWWVSRWIRRLLVVAGSRCPLTKPVVTAVELQATTEPHCSRGVQPGGIHAYVVQRELTPGGPGSGLRPGRKRFLCQLPLWFYIYASYSSCRSGSIYTLPIPAAALVLLTSPLPWAQSGRSAKALLIFKKEKKKDASLQCVIISQSLSSRECSPFTMFKVLLSAW